MWEFILWAFFIFAVISCALGLWWRIYEEFTKSRKREKAMIQVTDQTGNVIWQDTPISADDILVCFLSSHLVIDGVAYEVVSEAVNLNTKDIIIGVIKND